MEKYVKPLLLEQWNNSKGHFEEIKDMSLKFWKDEKLYFQIETIQEPINCWSNSVAKAIAHSRYIIWWAEGFKPHLCFRGTFNSEEELSEFLIKFKEFVIPSTLANGDTRNESWEQPTDATSSSQHLSLNQMHEIDDLISFREDPVDNIPCLSPGTVDDSQGGGENLQGKQKSIFTIAPRPGKCSFEERHTKSNEIRKRKRKKVISLPSGYHKKVIRPSKSNALLATIKAAFKFLLSDEEVDILVLSKSSEPIRIRTTCNNLKWSSGDQMAQDSPTPKTPPNEESLKEDISSEIPEENTLYEDKCLEDFDGTLLLQNNSADEISVNSMQEIVPSKKWDFSAVMAFMFCFLLIWVGWYSFL